MHVVVIGDGFSSRTLSGSLAPEKIVSCRQPAVAQADGRSRSSSVRSRGADAARREVVSKSRAEMAAMGVTSAQYGITQIASFRRIGGSFLFADPTLNPAHSQRHSISGSSKLSNRHHGSDTENLNWKSLLQPVDANAPAGENCWSPSPPSKERNVIIEPFRWNEKTSRTRKLRTHPAVSNTASPRVTRPNVRRPPEERSVIVRYPPGKTLCGSIFPAQDDFA